MDKRAILKEEFLRLRAEFQSSDPEGDELFLEKISSFLKDKTPEEKNMIAEIMTDSVEEDIQDLRQVRKELDLRDKLKRIDEAVSWSYIAKKYFGKSRSWLSQRLNNYMVNGKEAKFTPDELNILQKALFDLSNDIKETANGLSIN